MALAEEDIAFIKRHIGEWLAEQGRPASAPAHETGLLERMVRVEEELKHQRELMLQGFERMDQRFEQVEKRFEQVGRRLEAVGDRMDRFMRWSFGATLTASGIVIAAIKLLP